MRFLQASKIENANSSLKNRPSAKKKSSTPWVGWDLRRLVTFCLFNYGDFMKAEYEHRAKKRVKATEDCFWRELQSYKAINKKIVIARYIQPGNRTIEALKIATVSRPLEVIEALKNEAPTLLKTLKLEKLEGPCRPSREQEIKIGKLLWGNNPNRFADLDLYLGQDTSLDKNQIGELLVLGLREISLLIEKQVKIRAQVTQIINNGISDLSVLEKMLRILKNAEKAEEEAILKAEKVLQDVNASDLKAIRTGLAQ